jgi:phage shock protein A
LKEEFISLSQSLSSIKDEFVKNKITASQLITEVELLESKKLLLQKELNEMISKTNSEIQTLLENKKNLVEENATLTKELNELTDQIAQMRVQVIELKNEISILEQQNENKTNTEN